MADTVELSPDPKQTILEESHTATASDSQPVLGEGKEETLFKEMTETAPVTHLWDPDNSEDGRQISVSEHEIFHDTLINNISPLVKDVELSDKFWDLLLQRDVVNEKSKSEIQAITRAEAQALALVHCVMGLEVYKFHGFVWALVNSGQHHIAEVLGFAPHGYSDLDLLMEFSSFRCPACLEFYSKAYILTGCGHYICAPCVKGAEFYCKDSTKEDVTCPVPDCGTTTEAHPTDGNIGLKEDEEFKEVCQVLSKALSEQTVTDHQILKAEKSRKRKNCEVETLKGKIMKLSEDTSCLEKQRDVLGQQSAGIKDYITEKQDTIKQQVDTWAQENLEHYENLQQQVGEKLYQSLQWCKAARELSTILTLQPWLSDAGQEMVAILQEQQQTVTPEAEGFIKKLESGSSIPSLMTPFPQIQTPQKAVDKVLTGSAQIGATTATTTTAKFKVGDIVRVKPSIKVPWFKWGAAQPGEIGEVRDITTPRVGLVVDFPDYKGWRGLMSEMEVVRPADP